MAWFQDNMGRLSVQLRGLTVSQRVAIGLGAALVLASVFWLAQWAATPDMTPLLSQDLSGDDLARVTAGLDALGESYRTQGSRVLVRASANRQALLAQLQASEKLPTDTSVGFAALVAESNPWISQEENNKRWTVALQNEIRRVLRSFQGVRDAHVFLNLSATRRGFSRQEAQASASVTLFMQGGEPVTRALALNAARLVSGAVRGLPPQNVQVVDASGAVALDWDAEQPGTTTHLDRLRREQESRIRRMIEAQVAFDPQVRVSVRVELDPTAREKTTETPSEGVETSTSTRTREDVRTSRAEQPGLQANVGRAVGSSAGVDTRSSESESKSELRTGLEQKHERTAAGEIREIFAAINVSHSALAAIYRRANPGGDEPTREQIEQVFVAEKPKIINQVRKLVKPQEEDNVAVDWYYDEVAQSSAAEAEAGSWPMQLLERHGAAGALALLALLAMGFMLRLARRSDARAIAAEIGLPGEALSAARRAAAEAAPPAPPPPAQEGAPARIITDSQPPVTVASGQPVIEAPEVDDATLQVRKMVEQIGDLLDRDADTVASLVEKWVSEPR
ncbi:MAG: hypothetical protein LC135_08795 [Phycisphaerae bacterium]|nr:hypothetical protein [Phycisphaerae bacterium]MCZ2399948.1 hypothetical protein [Phycisphaerae bacterium]